MNLNDDDRAWLEKAGREHREHERNAIRPAWIRKAGLPKICKCCGCVTRYCICRCCGCQGKS